MQTYISSFQIIDNQFKTFKLFGYSTKGMPGVEVVGFGSYGRLLKEKIIYFTKSCGVKVSNRRYVICLESEDARELKTDHFQWFEIPALVLFWTLADVVPLQNIHDCFASGKIKANGAFEHHKIDKELIDQDKVIISEQKVEFMKAILLDEIIREASEREKLDQVV